MTTNRFEISGRVMRRIRVHQTTTHTFPTIADAILAGALIQPGDLVHITGKAA